MATTMGELRASFRSGLSRRRSRASRESLVVATAALAFVLLAEVMATAVAPRLPEPQRWVLLGLDEHESRMAELAAQGETNGILTIGSSTAGAGIDSEQLTLETGISSYTLWAAGVPVRSLPIMLDALGIPILRPRTVVIGLTSREMNDNGRGQDESHRTLLESPAWRQHTGSEGLLQRLDRLASRYSNLVEHRRELRDPETLAASLLDRNQDLVGSRGSRIAPREHLQLTPEHARQEREALAEFAVGGREAQVLTGLVEDLQVQGIDVLVVNLPVLEEEYLGLHPRGAEDQERYEQVLQAVVTETGAQYVDARASRDWQPSEFIDENHLNTSGAAQLTRIVAGHLQATRES